MARFRESGLTQRKFADQNAIAVSALQYWLRKEKHAVQGRESSGTRFVEVVGARSARGDTPYSNGLSVEFDAGFTLRFESLPSPEYLASVATVFATVARC